jgi:hypothetical protein
MEKNGVEDDVLIKYWAEILRIQDSNELLDLKNNQNKIISAVTHV